MKQKSICEVKKGKGKFDWFTSSIVQWYVYVIFKSLGLFVLQAEEKGPLCLEMVSDPLELNWMMSQKHQIGKDLIDFWELKIRV
jgi:hypothetical protein